MNSKNFFWPKNGPFIGQENLCMTSIKPVYVVHQTCVRGSFFDPSYNKKAAAKNFTPSAWNFFFIAEALPTDSHCALRDPRHSILPLSLSATTRSFYQLKTSHIGLSFFFENFSKLDSNTNREEHFEKIKIEKLLNKSNSQRQIDDRLSWVSTIRNAKIAQSFTTLGSIKVVYSSFEMIAQ